MRFRSSLLSLALFLLGAFLLTSSPTRAQEDTDDVSDLNNALQAVGTQYADSYVQPLSNAFGANMGGGLFRSADVGNSLIPGFPVDLYVGVSVSGTLTSSMQKSFAPDAEETFTRNGDKYTVQFKPDPDDEVPTAFGETNPPDANLVVERNGNQVGDPIRAPQGLVNTSIAPIVVPQIGIGSVVGTDVQVRYLPKIELSARGGSYGTVGLFGIAVRHDIDQWIPAPLPLELTVQGAWNQFSLENDAVTGDGTSEVLDVSGWAVNLQASRGVPVIPLTFYGGVQYEKFGVDYNYTFQPDGSSEPVSLSLEQDAANNFRGLAGFSLTFAIVRFNVDYAIGNENNVVTTGLGIRI